MILLDTCAMVFDALTPERLGKSARVAMADGERAGTLACSDISLWEIAMLIRKGRLDPGAPMRDFLTWVVDARSLKVLPITAAIAECAADSPLQQADPADRLIAATALAHGASVVTCDKGMALCADLRTIW